MAGLRLPNQTRSVGPGSFRSRASALPIHENRFIFFNSLLHVACVRFEATLLHGCDELWRDLRALHPDNGSRRATSFMFKLQDMYIKGAPSHVARVLRPAAFIASGGSSLSLSATPSSAGFDSVDADATALGFSEDPTQFLQNSMRRLQEQSQRLRFSADASPASTRSLSSATVATLPGLTAATVPSADVLARPSGVFRSPAAGYAGRDPTASDFPFGRFGHSTTGMPPETVVVGGATYFLHPQAAARASRSAAPAPAALSLMGWPMAVPTVPTS